MKRGWTPLDALKSVTTQFLSFFFFFFLIHAIAILELKQGLGGYIAIRWILTNPRPGLLHSNSTGLFRHS